MSQKMSMSAATSARTIILEPSSGWSALRLREVWDFRDLLYFLVWREVKVRYKQTALGVAWAIIQPLSTMLVFTVFFGRLGNLPSDGLPYPIFAFSALLPWQLLAFSVTEASNSVVANQRLITKVYFPRLIVPLSAVSVGLIDFLVSLSVLAGLMIYYDIVPGLAILTVPLWTLLTLLTALGVGLWLAALNVMYRDVRYILPLVTQLWMFASPVAYASSVVPEKWRAIYALNPMVGVIEGFRWSVLGRAGTPPVTVAISIVAVTSLVVSGLFFFRRMERTFADVI